MRSLVRPKEIVYTQHSINITSVTLRSDWPSPSSKLRELTDGSVMMSEHRKTSPSPSPFPRKRGLRVPLSVAAPLTSRSGWRRRGECYRQGRGSAGLPARLYTCASAGRLGHRPRPARPRHGQATEDPGAQSRQHRGGEEQSKGPFGPCSGFSPRRFQFPSPLPGSLVPPPLFSPPSSTSHPPTFLFAVPHPSPSLSLLASRVPLWHDLPGGRGEDLGQRLLYWS